jgi:glycosyltransferase involved in cell wall biosynthesis
MRVLRILTRANMGGPMRQAVNLWHEDSGAGLQTLIAVGSCSAQETEMPIEALPALDAANLTPDSRGVVRVSRLGRASRPWRDVMAVLELRRLIKTFRPDVVHTHTSQAGFFGRRAAFAERVPVIAHTYHGHVLSDYYSKPVSAVIRHLEMRLARRTDTLFAVSESCRSELHGLGVGAGRIEVLPPAVDVAPFARASRAAARSALDLAPGDFAIGMVGRLVPIKRPEWFVQLVAQLGSAMPGVRGFVFGDGPLAGELASQIASQISSQTTSQGRNGAGGRLELRGATAAVERYLAGLDALVLCSRREGCPLVALEAFAAGVPVIGFDVPGVRDVLGAWGAGLSVPEASGVAGLAAAARRLARESGLAADLVAQARQGLSRFAPASIAGALRRNYAAVGERREEIATPPFPSSFR